MKIELENKVALVTGGTGAIGRMICHYLGQSGCKLLVGHAGHHPHVSERMLAQEVQNGCQIKLLKFNVSDFDATSAAIAAGESEFGKVDILVNAAGITRDKPLKKMTPEDWREVVDVDLTGVFNCTRPVVEGMITRGWGRVINISSINGQKGQYGQANYSAAKAGVHGFTMAVSRELARDGITVNTISPGYIESPMIHGIPDDIRAHIEREIPIGRFGQPEDVAAMVTFLASEHASWITGADFAVNGGHFIG